MSSKRAMKQAQKQAYAKHRSTLLIIDLEIEKKTSQRKIKKVNFLF